MAQVQSAAQLPAQIAGGGFQTLHGIGGLLLLEEADIDLGIAKIRGGLHPGDGNHGVLDSGILQIADQRGQLLLDLLIDTVDTIRSHSILLSQSQPDKWVFGGDAPAGNSHVRRAIIVIALTRPVTQQLYKRVFL